LRRAVRSLAVARFPLRVDSRERFALLSSVFSLCLVRAPPSCAGVLVSSVELSICTRHDARSRLLGSPEHGGGCVVVVDTGEVTVVVVEAGPVDVVVVLATVVDVARGEVLVVATAVVVVVVVTGAVDVVVLVAGTVVVVVVSHAASQQGRLGWATCFACGVTDAPGKMWMMSGLSR